MLLLSLPGLHLQFLYAELPECYPLYSHGSTDLQQLIYEDNLLHSLDVPLHLPHLPMLLLQDEHPVQSQEILLPFLYPDKSESYPLLQSSNSLAAVPISVFQVVLPHSFRHISLPLPYLVTENDLLQCTFL